MKKLVLFVLSVMMMLPIMVNAQFTATFGTGTSSTTTGGAAGAPMSYGGAYSWCQQIYRAAEFTAAGVPAGAVITAIEFYNATGATTMSDLRTYMGSRSTDYFSGTSDWAPYSTLTLVDSGDWVTTGTGWFSIQLDQPYVWDGTSNLVVGVSFRGAHSDYSTNNPNCGYQYTAQSGNAHIRRFSTTLSSCDPTSTASANSVSSARPNLRITYLVSNCPSLTPTVANIGPYSADLNWMNYNQSAFSFDLVYGEASTFDTLTSTIITNITDTFYSLTGLTSSTAYKACIKSHCSTESGTWSAPRNFSTLEACPKPTQVTISSVGAYDATVTWTPGFNETSWELVCVPHGTSMSAGTPDYPTSTTYQITNLTPATSYDVYVRADCGTGEYSYWTAATTFATSCVPLTTLPFTENFDSYTGSTSTSVSVNNLPNCWAHINNGTSSSYTGYPAIYNSSSYAASGTNAMRFYVYTSTAYDDQIAILPSIDPIAYAINTLQLSFDARSYSSSYTFTIVVGVMSNPTDVTTFVPVGTITTSTGAYENFEIPFSQYTGSGTFIAVRAPKPSSSYNWGLIDNIMVDLAPNCTRPSHVVLGGITTTSVTVDWTPTDSETAWEVAVVPQGQSLANATPEQAYTHPYTVSNLNDDTQYNVYVRGVCPTSGYSSWTSVVSFRTDPFCTPPTNVSVSQIRGTSALVTWNSALVGADSYTVEYSEHNLNNWVPATVSATQYMLSGLTPQTSYDVMVYSNCQLGDADTVSKTFMTGCISGGEISIGTGTMTNEYIPSYSYYEDGYSQQIYLASELGGATTLSSIAFQLQALAQQRSYTIYLMHTTATSLSSGWIPTTGAQQVFSGAQTLVQGWNTFNFTTPFQYNGIDNLLVIVLDATGSYVDGNYWYTHSATAGARYVYEDGTIYTLTPPSDPGELLNERNNVKFGGACDNTITCVAPNAYVVGATESSVTVDWAPGNTESSWQMEYSTDGTNWTQEGSVTAPHTLTSLNANTDYSIRLRSDCSGSYSDWTMVHAHTPCAAANIPLTESFDNATGSGAGNMVACWSTLTNSATAYPYTSTTYHHSGNYSVYFYGTSTTHAYLVSPRLDDAVSMNNLQVSFWAYKTSANYYIQVGVMTDPNDPNTFVQVGSNSSPSATSSWELLDVNTTLYTGQGKYIAFRIPENISNGMYIDDINIDIVPNCIHVANLHTTSVDSTNATISWTAGGSESYWDLYIMEGTGAVDLDTVVPISVSETTYVATGLHPGTVHTVYVRSNCGSEYSLWMSCNFLTTQTPGQMPYFCDFEDAHYQFGFANGTATNQWHVGTGANHGGTHALYISNNNGASNSYTITSSSDVWAYRDIYFPACPDGYNLSFDWHSYGESCCDYMKVYLGDPMTPTAGSTAQPSGSTVMNPNVNSSYADRFNITSGYQTFSYTIPGMTVGAIKRLYFYWHNDGSVGTMPPAAVDNISISPIYCTAPSSVSVSNVSAYGADVTWTAPATVTNFVLYYKSDADATWTIDNNATSPYTLSGLNPSTHYTVRVASDCGDGEHVSPFVTTDFNTSCVPMTTIPYSENFDTYTGTTSTSTNVLPACWSRLNGGTSYTGLPTIYNSSSAANSGPNCLYFYTYTTSGTYADQYAILPEIDVTTIPLNTLQISMSAKPYSTSYPFVIQVGVMTDPTQASTFQLVQTISVTGSAHQQKEAYFSNYTGTGGYIALKVAKPSSGYNYGYIDDIVVSLIPNCSPVTNLTVSQIAGTSALLSWDAGHFGTVASYIVEYTEHGTNNWTPATSSATTSPFMLGGLNPGTSYDVRVKTTCTDYSESDWVMETFNTKCLAGGEVAVGNGTITDEEFIPSYSCYNFTLTEQLYTASEIGSAGTISSISFNAYSVTTTPRNWAVYLMPTTQTSLTGYVAMDATAVKVYEGSVNITQGWFTINFTTPFQYDGTSNLILAIDDNTGSYVCTNEYYSHLNPNGNSYCYYTDDSSENPDPTSTSTPTSYVDYTDYRANTIFGMPCDSNATCVAPNIYVSGFTTNTATIEWVPGYLEGLWDMEYQVFGDTLWTSAGSQTTSPATLTNLLSGTRYNVRMRSDCGGGDVSNWVGASFSTECDAYAIPFTENFDSYAGATSTSVNESNLPLCWQHINTGTQSGYTGYPIIYNSSSSASSSPNALRFYAGTGTYGSQMAILPPIDVTQNLMNTLQVSFDMRAMNTSYPFNLVVGVMTDPTNMNTFVPVDTVTSQVTTYGNYEVLLNQYSGSGTYIGLLAYQPLSYYNYGYVDNVVVELIPTCPKPHDLSITNVTQNTATLGWTEMGSASSWVVEYGSAGFTPGTGAGTTVQVQSTPSTTITGLNANTLYDFYVQADCGGGDISSWSMKTSGRTACNATTIPYSENFDNMGTGSGTLPPCWSGMNTYSTTTLYPYISTSYHTSGNASLYFYCSSSTYNIAVLPYVDVTLNPINTLQLSFMMRSTSGTTSTITVGVMTNPLDANTFTPITQVNNSTTGTFESKEVSLSSYTGQGAYVALKLTNTSSTYSVYIDDILLETIPTCPKPTNLTATNATVNSISLSWTEAGTAQNWEVEYGPMGFTVGQGTTVQVTGTPSTTITGLTASTTYDFYVKSDCGGGDVSIYSAKLTASTTMTPTALPYTANFSSASDAWVLNNGSCPNYWMRGTYSGSGALFVTNDGSTPGYNTSSSSMVSAQKLFAVGTSPNVTITFDVQVDGEGSYDYLKLFFAPPAQQYPASTSSPSSSDYGYHDYSTYAYNFYNNGYGTQSSHVYVLNKLSGTVHVQAVMDNPNPNPTASSTALLVFAWRNDPSVGTQPPAIITNLTVTGTGSGPAPTCDVPTGLAVGNLAQTTATATWNAGGTEAAWDLQYKQHSASSWGNTIPLTARNYNFTSLTAGTQYDVRVRANCGSNNYSDWTAAVTFTTLNQGQDPCNDPTNLTATNVTSNSVVLDWTENGTATSWTVNYKEVNAANWSTTTASSKPYTLIGLQPETAYSAYVVANCTSGQSGATNTVTFTTESTGIADYELATTLYPNPNNGQFTINNEQFTINNVNVYDVYGKLLKTVEVNSNTAVIDAHELAAGMYFVRISTEKGVVTKSFVKK